MKLPILMYHRVLKDPAIDLAPHQAVYTLPAGVFESQMETLSREGFHSVTFRDLEDLWKSEARDKATRRVMLTFDDGTDDHYETVYPILKRLRLKGVFYVATGLVGEPGYVTWTQLQEMSEDGMDIESHSHSHPFLPELEAAEVERELSLSKKLIEEHLGRPVVSLGIPGGFYNPGTLSIAEGIGYRYVCTSRWGINVLTPRTRLFRRISIFSKGATEMFRAALDGRELYILGRRMIRVPLSIPKRLLGPTRYARLRRWFFSLTKREQ
jgi:peptidoglycan/xylan/chitin deacetylase (PgdA/CDA1 family)